MLLNSKRHIDRRGGEVSMIKLLFNNNPCLPKHKSKIRRFSAIVFYLPLHKF